MRNNSILLFFVCFLTAGFSLAVDSDVSHTEILIKTNNYELAGKLIAPKNRTVSKTVIFLHGMSGDMDGPQVHNTNTGLFEAASETFASSGINSVLFSTSGTGGSNGNFLDMTLTRRSNEVISTIEFLKEEMNIDYHDLVLVGFSQGSSVALMATGKLANLQKQLGGLILWSPNSNPRQRYRASMGVQTYEEALNTDAMKYVEWGGSGNKVRRFHTSFVRDLENLNIFDGYSEFSGPTLIVSGELDRWVNDRDINIVIANSGGNVEHLSYAYSHRMSAPLGLSETEDFTKDMITWMREHTPDH